ncbi:MAG: hypothetical protein KY469_01190 [Actinobacteria bacterium]|nr:hypothetical protein [Actinomycetota bacterium]
MVSRRALSVALASAAASLTLWVGPAAAGGWWSWIQLDDTYLAIGEEVTARATVMFPTVAEADAARVHQGYAAYLLRGIDVAALEEAMMVPEPGAWWSPPEVALEVGAVDLKDGDANLLVAEASFTVPEVETGEWALMFCDAGCVNPLADVAPTLGLHIAADVQSATLTDELSEQVAVLDTDVPPVTGSGGPGWLPIGGGIVGSVALASILPRRRRG